MKINDIFFENEYSNAFEYVTNHNLNIIEIEPDENGRRFQIVQPQVDETIQKEVRIIDELARLKNWFNEYYTIHEQQYRRLHTLGDTSAYDKLIALYNEAEIKRARIQELERLLSETEIIERKGTNEVYDEAI